MFNCLIKNKKIIATSILTLYYKMNRLFILHSKCYKEKKNKDNTRIAVFCSSRLQKIGIKSNKKILMYRQKLQVIPKKTSPHAAQLMEK